MQPPSGGRCDVEEVLEEQVGVSEHRPVAFGNRSEVPVREIGVGEARAWVVVAGVGDDGQALFCDGRSGASERASRIADMRSSDPKGAHRHSM